MTIPEDTRTRVIPLLQKFVDDVPTEVRNQLSHRYRFIGNDIHFLELRPSFMDKTIWKEHEIAKVKYNVSAQDWTLYYQDRNLKWHKYPNFEHVESFVDCYNEIINDPTCIFFG